MDILLPLTILATFLALIQISPEYLRQTFRFKIGFRTLIYIAIIIGIVLGFFPSEFILPTLFGAIIFLYFIETIIRKESFISYLEDLLIQKKYGEFLILFSKYYYVFKFYKDIDYQDIFNGKNKMVFLKKKKIKFNEKLDNLLNEMFTTPDFIEYLVKNDIKTALKILKINRRVFPRLFWEEYFPVLIKYEGSRLYTENKDFFSQKKILTDFVFGNYNNISKLKSFSPFYIYLSKKIFQDNEISKSEIHLLEVIYKKYIKTIFESRNKYNKLTIDFEELIDDIIWIYNKEKKMENLNVIDSFHKIYFETIISLNLEKLNPYFNINENVIYSMIYCSIGSIIKLFESEIGDKSKIPLKYLILIITHLNRKSKNLNLYKLINESIEDYDKNKKYFKKMSSKLNKIEKCKHQEFGSYLEANPKELNDVKTLIINAYKGNKK